MVFPCLGTKTRSSLFVKGVSSRLAAATLSNAARVMDLEVYFVYYCEFIVES